MTSGLQLLENCIATGAALTALILALQPMSAAFNPLVTPLEAGARAASPPATRSRLVDRAQLVGGSSERSSPI